MEPVTLPAQTLQWIHDLLGPGSNTIAVYPQRGATSSTLNRLEVMVKGRTLHFMLRRYTNTEWLEDEPLVAQHEAASLQQVRSCGVSTPELVAYDLDGSRAGVPALLMTLLPGQVELLPQNLDDWLLQQAGILLPIHATPTVNFAWRYAPYNNVSRLVVPAWSHRPQEWEKAIEIVNGAAPEAPLTFIHRDYHPVNVLWKNERISGLVDWANACLGPACIDVSWSRANLASLYGVTVAELFLSHYQTVTGGDGGYHPYWDLMVIIDFLPGPPDVYPPWVEFGVAGLTDELMVERAEAYLASVLQKLR